MSFAQDLLDVLESESVVFFTTCLTLSSSAVLWFVTSKYADDKGLILWLGESFSRDIHLAWLISIILFLTVLAYVLMKTVAIWVGKINV